MPSYEPAKKLFFRCFGTGPAKKRFWLGRNQREAIIQEARLEQVWQLVQPHGWDDVSLTVAKSVARGEHSVKLPPTELLGDELVDWTVRQVQRFGHIISVNPADEERLAMATAIGMTQLEGFAKTQIAIGENGRQLMAEMHKGPRLKTIFAGHRAALERERDEQGDKSGWIGTQIRQLDAVDRLFGDVQLNTAADLRSVANRLANPDLKSGHGKPLARITRRKLFQQLRAALTRADETEVLPRGWAAVKLPNKRDMEPEEVAQFTVDDLRALYTAANPLMRRVIVLALNCGWQPADFGDLADKHVFIGRPLPSAVADRADAKKSDAWIMMHRGKTYAPGLHRLWPESVDALNWLAARRDRLAPGCPFLFVNDAGKPFMGETAGRNHNAQVANHWNRTKKDAAKLYPQLQTLPIKFLRKASGNYLRRFTTDDVVAMHLRHGHCSPDKLLEAYCSRPWSKLNGPTDALRELFAPVFQGDMK